MLEQRSHTNKIYFLRHEQRNPNTAFRASLTAHGLTNAETIIYSQLENISIGTIYCSPFIRTLQTIKPYCDKTGKKKQI